MRSCATWRRSTTWIFHGSDAPPLHVLLRRHSASASVSSFHSGDCPPQVSIMALAGARPNTNTLRPSRLPGVLSCAFHSRESAGLCRRLHPRRCELLGPRRFGLIGESATLDWSLSNTPTAQSSVFTVLQLSLRARARRLFDDRRRSARQGRAGDGSVDGRHVSLIGA
jgi:hypothetical protein